MSGGRGADSEATDSATKYLEALKSSRGSPAVLKLRLAHLRALTPDGFVFAFEGIDDKTCYSQWIRILRPDLNYEPFLCDGKAGVLNLHGVVLRDKTGIGANLFFFVDRDFDDLRGTDQSQCMFMTDRYSVENYLVTEAVIIEVLKNEFHCHGRPDLRKTITGHFAQCYGAFLSATKELNERIFIARKCDIKLKHQLPSKLNAFAEVTLQSVKVAGKPADQLVAYFSEPDPIELPKLKQQFLELEPSSRYRGKFAFMFLQKWLEQLAQEYGSGALGLFADLHKQHKVLSNQLVMANFASKSDMPDRLANFISGIGHPSPC